jgi:hypothetical protein
MDEYSGLKSLYVPGYRLNESQPIPLPMGELYQFSRAAQEGVNAGVSPLAKTLFPGKVLHEGRADAGTNEANLNNKNARAVYYDVGGRLMEDPIVSEYNRASLYPAAVEDKLDVSKRTGIPFERVWNGTGKSAATGRTGSQHAQRAAVHEAAVEDPRNIPYLDYITRAQQGKTTARENLAAMYGTNNRGLLSVFNNPRAEQENINKYLGKGQFDIPEGEVNAFLKHPSNLAMAYADRSGIEFPKKPADWERPVWKEDKKGQRTLVKGSPTYQERMNQYSDYKELKDFEARYPQAKAYLDQRMGKSPEGLKQQNAFMTWLLDHEILVRDKSDHPDSLMQKMMRK